MLLRPTAKLQGRPSPGATVAHGDRVSAQVSIRKRKRVPGPPRGTDDLGQFPQGFDGLFEAIKQLRLFGERLRVLTFGQLAERLDHAFEFCEKTLCPTAIFARWTIRHLREA